jgi:hypothetical protein
MFHCRKRTLQDRAQDGVPSACPPAREHVCNAPLAARRLARRPIVARQHFQRRRQLLGWDASAHRCFLQTRATQLVRAAGSQLLQECLLERCNR